MFDNDIKIYGKHSEIIKKYSRDKQSSEQIPFTLDDNEGNINIYYIFDTMIQCYMVAAMLGIINHKSVVPDKDTEKKITIFAAVVMKPENRANLQRIYQHMVLSENSDLSIDGKIKQAFTVNLSENSDEELIKLNGYVCGGLEIIDSYFSSCTNFEEVCNSFLKLLNDLGYTDEDQFDD